MATEKSNGCASLGNRMMNAKKFFPLWSSDEWNAIAAMGLYNFWVCLLRWYTDLVTLDLRTEFSKQRALINFNFQSCLRSTLPCTSTVPHFHNRYSRLDSLLLFFRNDLTPLAPTTRLGISRPRSFFPPLVLCAWQFIALRATRKRSKPASLSSMLIVKVCALCSLVPPIFCRHKVLFRSITMEPSTNGSAECPHS